MMSWGGDWGWGAALAMAAMMAAFWALLIWAVLTVTRRADSDRDSESILAERFARGDIDDAEYRQRRDLLRSSR
jgi:putative membrane protein